MLKIKINSIIRVCRPILFCSAILFSSCHDVIFDSIRDEVELEDAQISGDVNSIVRFNLSGEEHLFIQNGNIWKKKTSNESAHGWSQTGKPSASADYRYVNRLAADSNYIYAQMTLLNENSDEGEIQSSGTQIFYSTDGNEWKGPLEFTNAKGEKITTISSGYSVLFCTNSIKNENRKAYLRIADKSTSDTTYYIYELNGATFTEKLKTKGTTSTDNPSATISYNSNSCAYFKNAVYFWSGNALATDETESADATMLYASSDASIKYSSDGTTFSSVSPSISTIRSLSVTKDYLYAGTAKGIEHISLNDSKIPTSKSDFNTNADSTLSSYYDIKAVLALNPDKNESENTIYGTTTFSGSTSSTSATQQNVGLWAFYKSRGKWNRE